VKKISIIGRRYDVVVILSLFLSSVAMEYIVESFTHDETYYQTHWWPIMVPFLFSALISHQINIHFGGEDYLEKPPITNINFFSINSKYWPMILLVMGLFFGLFIIFSNL
jgi:hypothetical protein